MEYLTILGSTGSIGHTAISVAQQHNDRFFIYALVAKNNVAIMTKQCLLTSPKYACLTCENASKQLKENLVLAGKNDIKVLSGMTGACILAALNEIDTVISAIVGIAGLKPTFSALRAGKKILLANKETLVTSGQLFMKEANKYHSKILPVDSEHNAIFQNLPVICQEKLGKCLLSDHGVCKIVLTASGGAFLGISHKKLSMVTPELACNHPNWSMGPKISIDSATMMNKGLEYIEARHLFNANPDEIQIVLHPQSIVHGMVQYTDGSILAHFSPPDMKIPIAHAMAYPDRIKLKNIVTVNKKSNTNDIYLYSKLHFSQLDSKHYPCLNLAIEVSNHSQAATIILNAANEVAVEAFLHKKISFTAIPNLIYHTLDVLHFKEPNSIEDILYIDRKSKEMAICYVNKL